MNTCNYKTALNFAIKSGLDSASAHRYAVACQADGAVIRKNGRARAVRRAKAAWAAAQAPTYSTR